MTLVNFENSLPITNAIRCIKLKTPLFKQIVYIFVFEGISRKTRYHFLHN